MASAVGAISNTAKALLGKQLEGEPPVDVESDEMQMKVRRASYK